jgi:methyltransferase
MLSVYLLLFVIVPFLLIETWRSMHNERGLRRRGAVEPPDDVYPLMSAVYPTSFIVMTAEGAWRGGPQPPWLLVGLALFALSKLLKFYVIAVLGDRWTFRVLVPPGAPLVARGLYKFMRHPNYVAVIGELLGVAVMMPAPISGAITVIVFALILWKRIAVEERALGIRPS